MQATLQDRDVIVVYHLSDQALAQALAAFLHAGAPVRVPLDEGAIQDDETLLEAVERAASATAVVVLLSPHAVKNKGSGPDWEKLELDVPLASVLLAPCVSPGVLRRHRWYDASNDRLMAFRSVKRWLLDPRRSPAKPTQLGEMETLRTRIADRPGKVRLPTGSTMVRDFANALASEFQEAVYMDCQWRSPENLLVELGWALGLRLEGPPEEHLREIRGRLRDSRCLLALDNLDDARMASDVAGPRCSILTSKPGHVPPPNPVELIAELREWARDPDAALQLLPRANVVFDREEWPIAAEVGRLSFLLLNRQKRYAEAYAWLDRLSEEAVRQGDRTVLVESERERGWILERWGAQSDSPLEPHAGPVQLELFSDLDL